MEFQVAGVANFGDPLPDPAAADSAQNICLSSDPANPLSRSRSSWAGGDGSSVCTLARVSRGGGLKGATDSAVSRVLAKRPLRRFLRFTPGPRGTGGSHTVGRKFAQLNTKE
jgi:hypothetical protein